MVIGRATGGLDQNIAGGLQSGIGNMRLGRVLVRADQVQRDRQTTCLPGGAGCTHGHRTGDVDHVHIVGGRDGNRFGIDAAAVCTVPIADFRNHSIVQAVDRHRPYTGIFSGADADADRHGIQQGVVARIDGHIRGTGNALIDLHIRHTRRGIAFHVGVGVGNTQIALADLHDTGHGDNPLARGGIGVGRLAAVFGGEYIGVINGIRATEVEITVDRAATQTGQQCVQRGIVFTAGVHMQGLHAVYVGLADQSLGVGANRAHGKAAGKPLGVFHAAVVAATCRAETDPVHGAGRDGDAVKIGQGAAPAINPTDDRLDRRAAVYILVMCRAQHIVGVRIDPCQHGAGVIDFGKGNGQSATFLAAHVQ